MSDTSFYNISDQTTELSTVHRVLEIFGSEHCIRLLKSMMLIREFEVRGEEAYLEGLVGGFYHSYIGEEAIATAALANTGMNQWFFASYRCHAVAVLMGLSIRSLAAELLGKETGCALGRGGSMHMCGDRFPGGFGIVGGHIPLAAGAAFAAKYQNKDQISLCFIGDGAVAQGVFHETLNYVSLHNLPLMLIIENNGWGMGTASHRAIAKQPIAEAQGPSYNIRPFMFNGFDLFNCLLGFREAYNYMKSSGKPALIECLCSRFKGHSISDPNLYRSKQEMQCLLKRDPILFAKSWLVEAGVLSEEEYSQLRKECRDKVVQAFSEAKADPFPPITTLEEGVYA